MKTKEETDILVRKLNSIEVAKKTLITNIKKSTAKNANIHLVQKNLKEKIKKINKIINIQKQGRNTIESIIYDKNFEYVEKKKEVEAKIKQLEANHNQEMTTNLKNISERELKESEKLKKEYTSIKTILGLYVLQEYYLYFNFYRYFIKVDIDKGFDEKLTYLSKHFRNLNSKAVQILEDKTDKILFKYSNKKETSFTLSSNEELISISNTKNKSSKSLRSLKSSEEQNKEEVANIFLSELKLYYNSINIDFNQMFEFYKKVSSQIESFKYKIKELNIKVIILLFTSFFIF